MIQFIHSRYDMLSLQPSLLVAAVLSASNTSSSRLQCKRGGLLIQFEVKLRRSASLKTPPDR